MASFLNEDFIDNLSQSDEETACSYSSSHELLYEDDSEHYEPLSTEEEAAEYEEQVVREDQSGANGT